MSQTLGQIILIRVLVSVVWFFLGAVLALDPPPTSHRSVLVWTSLCLTCATAGTILTILYYHRA
jgi:hypothetical protein